MSVSIGYGNLSKQTHLHQQLLRNILDRLDSLESFQMKPYLKTSFTNNDIYKQVQKLEQNMKIIVNTNLQNLRMIEDNMRQNIQQLYQKVRSFQNKIIHTLKQNQEAMQYLQFRASSVQSSQKNVTQFMKKLSEHQSQKYSGVNILQQRLKQIQHLFQLKYQKTNDNIKIIKQQTTLQISRSVKALEQKLQKNMKQIKLDITQNKTKNDSQLAIKQQIDELRSKLRNFQIQFKQNKNNYSHLQQICKLSQQNVSKVIKKLQSLQKEIKSNQSSQKNIRQQIPQPKFNTQAYQNDYNSQMSKNNSKVPKKTEPSHKKSSLPPKNIPQQNKINPHDLLGRPSSRRQLSEADSEAHQQSNKKIIIHHDDESDQDPFQNMVGGIRGLLKKSKQKQVKNDSKKKLNQNILDIKKPLPRQQKLGQLNYQQPKNHLMNKNLPPVKGDVKKQNKPSYIKSEQNQEDEQVYQVDQDGYLVDEQGNYLYDQDGNRVQIQQDMYDLIQQRR